MRLLRVLSQRMRTLFRHSETEDSLERELELHVEQLTRQFVKEGFSEPEARRLARCEFGPIDLAKEQCRDMRRTHFVEDFAKDLIYAGRVLRKSPGFTITAVVSLALGIGANTVVFSILNTLLLRPLPIAAPDRVFSVNSGNGFTNSFPNYRALRDRNAAFESLFAYRIVQTALESPSGTQRAWGFLVTGNYFQSLGLQPAAGRFFTPAEDTSVGASPYAVISYACWQNRFGADPEIAGKQIRVNNRPYTVVGVAPRGFHGTEVFYWSDVWVPMTMQPQIEGNNWLDCNNCFNAMVAGRLKRGITPRQAEGNLAPIAAQLARERIVNEGLHLTLSPPGMAGSWGRDPARAFAGGLMLLASLVLLAACANLAALLTARAADRERDLAIRVSIGAGRGRIVRQLFTESLVVSVAGGVAGCLVAFFLLRLISQWRAPLGFPVQFDVTADWRVFTFASLAAIFTGILFGIGPARRAWKADPALSLKGITVRSNPKWTARDLLLPVQIALCCVLVTASLVAVRGLMRSFRMPLGFQPDGVAVIGYDTVLAGYDPTRSRSLDDRVLDRIAHLPGVESAALASSVPLSIDVSHNGVFPENTTDFRNKYSFSATRYAVSPGYFHVAGTRLIEGREFTPQDDAKSPPVAIVNLTFARTVVGTADAVGRHFYRGAGGPGTLVEIVGVVEDGKYENLSENPRQVMFLPFRQNYSSSVMMLARSPRPEAELAAEMRQTVSALDSNIAIYGIGSLRQMLGFVYLPMHAAAIALGSFGVLALMLSLTGIYGLAAYTVSRRSRETGIRMAIGARPAQVLRSVFARLSVIVAVGALAGLALGFAGAGVLAAIVYQATSRDPIVIGAAVVSIAVVALAAAVGPARRAISVDPLKSLRCD